MGAGNLVSQGKKREREKCKTCGRTCCARQGTMCVGLHKPEKPMVLVVTLLASGCPVQAMVHALGWDERTVARWQERAGAHCQHIQEDQVLAGKRDLQPVHADEIRGKGWNRIPWIAMAMMVSTRVWFGGVVSLRRDRTLAETRCQLVNACCQPWCALLVLTDGWASSPGSLRRAFRANVNRTTGRGRSRRHAWPEIVIGTVITKIAHKRVVEILRRLTQGGAWAAVALLAVSHGGTPVHTACLERVHATCRERLASLTRRCRHAARTVSRREAGLWLVGCTSHCCFPHHEVRRRAAQTQARRGDLPITPAMASGFTDPVWSVRALLLCRIVPPLWVEPKRRGRPPAVAHLSKKREAGRPRPVLRLRKGVFCTSTMEGSPT